MKNYPWPQKCLALLRPRVIHGGRFRGLKVIRGEIAVFRVISSPPKLGGARGGLNNGYFDANISDSSDHPWPLLIGGGKIFDEVYNTKKHEIYFVEWREKCIFAVRKFMFPVGVHKFLAQKHMFLVQKHKFSAQKHKIVLRKRKPKIRSTLI